jgi:threonine dehydrogenase-like Zn-dependent dehydrogenase
VGLCGTDVEEYLHGPLDVPADAPHPRSGFQAPIAQGHEVVGVVVECADRPEWVGRRVIPDVVEGCRNCWWCARHEEGLCPELVVLGMHAPGGLADYMVCRSETLVEVPAHVDPDTAAFAEPVAVAVRAVAKAGDLRGATVVVVGAGVVGNLIIQVAKVAGALVIAQDPSDKRRDLARVAGAVGVAADATETAALVRAATAGRLADVVFECAGREQAFEDSVALTRSAGTVVLVGLSAASPALPWRDVVLGEKRLLGTAAHMWDVDVATAVRLLADGTVDPHPLMSDVVGLDGVVDALERLSQPNDLAKVLVDPARGGTQ